MLGYREGVGYHMYMSFDRSSKMSKNKSQNGLRRYPELLPHQLRPISTYPNPPISHIGKSKFNVVFVIFFIFRGEGLLITPLGYLGDLRLRK